jgi:archaellum biogenesis ATPase FlaH
MDIKAEGGFVVVPCSLHASGAAYAFDPTLASLDLSTLRELPSMLLTSTVATTTSALAAGKLGTGIRNDTLTSIAGKLRDRGVGAGEIEAALKSLNAIVCDPPLSDTEIQRTAASIAKYPAGVQPTIRFIGADELIATVPPNVEWVVPGIVALGSITELTGQPKEAGKSTLVRSMVSAMLLGSQFLGMQTMQCSVVMLSEERDRTLSYAVAQHAIGSGSLRVLQRHRIDGAASWPQIVEASVAEMKRIGAKVLVIDTLSYWALGDADENSASDALRAMDPLLKAAAEDIAIIIVRHMRKSGGDTVTAARGSSAITGSVDVVCMLSHHAAGPTFRVIDATGRFRESVFKLVIELTPSNTYVQHGNGQQIAQQAQLALEQLVISQLRPDEPSALAEKEILALLAKSPKPIGRTKLSETLKELVKAGAIRQRGRGTNNDPMRYWAP